MGVIEPASSFIGSAPEADWARPPWRTINERTVEAVVRAIRQQEAIWVSYQSMTSLDESVTFCCRRTLWATTVFAGTCARFAISASASRFRPRPNPAHRWLRGEPSGRRPGFALANCIDAGACTASRFTRCQETSPGVGLSNGGWSRSNFHAAKRFCTTR